MSRATASLKSCRGNWRAARPEVYQLMGEALYFYFLIVYARDSSNEQQVIDTVLGWSPTPVSIPPELVAGLTPGIANPGGGVSYIPPVSGRPNN